MSTLIHLISEQIWHVFANTRPKKSPAWNVNWSRSPMTYVYTSATYSPQCVHGYQNTKIRWSCCRSHPLIITRDHILNIIWFVKPAAIWMRHCIIWCIDKIKPSCKSNIKCSTEIVVSSSFFNSVYDHRSSNTICNDNVFPQPFFDETRCLYNINPDNFVCLLPIAALSFAIKIFICHTIRAEILLFTLDDDIAFSDIQMELNSHFFVIGWSILDMKFIFKKSMVAISHISTEKIHWWGKINTKLAFN